MTGQSVDLRQLEIFARVAALGSFSRAAEALHLTQPTVSEHIRALEDELGIRLLDRLGRGAVLTKAGHLLIAYAHRLLDLLIGAAAPVGAPRWVRSLRPAATAARRSSGMRSACDGARGAWSSRADAGRRRPFRDRY
ncbi:MAG TPA: LysR family transcriptional regulator [Candidatus Binatia bacterium]|nr:LysR family transcriptional regulator [Candidatus Binatia bacterium]